MDKQNLLCYRPSLSFSSVECFACTNGLCVSRLFGYLFLSVCVCVFCVIVAIDFSPPRCRINQRERERESGTMLLYCLQGFLYKARLVLLFICLVCARVFFPDYLQRPLFEWDRCALMHSMLTGAVELDPANVGRNRPKRRNRNSSLWTGKLTSSYIRSRICIVYIFFSAIE